MNYRVDFLSASFHFFGINGILKSCRDCPLRPSLTPCLPVTDLEPKQQRLQCRAWYIHLGALSDGLRSIRPPFFFEQEEALRDRKVFMMQSKHKTEQVCRIKHVEQIDRACLGVGIFRHASDKQIKNVERLGDCCFGNVYFN